MRIKDIGVTITGKTPSTKESGYFGGTIPFFTPEDIAKGFFLSKPSRTITESGFKSIKSNTLDGLSILVGCIGSDMGNVAVYDGKCATNQQINAITQVRNDINPLYIYYYLSTQKRYLRQIAGTTTTPILPKSTFDEIEIPIPTKRDQDTIVSILSALDRKISHNSHICAELDAMTRTLYDYWFVQFDFPDEHGRPYRTSGGAMEYCPALGREIPKGWKADSIEHIISIVRGISYQPSDELLSRTPESLNLLKSNNIQDGRINYENPVYLPAEKANADQWLNKGSVFITMSSGSKLHMGKTAIVHDDIPYVFGAFCAKIVIEPLYRYWLSIYFRHDHFRAYIENVTLGTNINNINANHITSIKVPFPPEKTLLEFNAVLSTCFDKLGKLMHENTELQNLRDWLLPMLMNGQAKAY